MTRIHSTADLIEDLAQATDMELAIAYDHCENIDTLYPLYLIKDEMDQRDLTFDEIEGLLATLGD
tara:strand:- start:82 stop:276 length:195 start_codon:yes stop_codon:yes gene_type:complete